MTKRKIGTCYRDKKGRVVMPADFAGDCGVSWDALKAEIDKLPEKLPKELKDSGTRRAFASGSVRDAAEGKGRYDLLPCGAIRRLALHYERGARKYAPRNWEKGQPFSVLYDSALRHAFKALAGQTDEDHLAAAVWNLCAIMEFEERGRDAELNDLKGGEDAGDKQPRD